MKLFKIGELAEKTGLSVQTVRFYESKRLISSEYRAPNGYRYFHPRTVPILRMIRHYKGLNFTLKEIDRLLTYYKDSDKFEHEITRSVEKKITELTKRMDFLSKARQVLESKLSFCPTCQTPSKCKIMKECIETPEML